MSEAEIRHLERRLRDTEDEVDRLRTALTKVRAHTSYTTPTIELLQGLLQSIERITDAALEDGDTSVGADDAGRGAGQNRQPDEHEP